MSDMTAIVLTKVPHCHFRDLVLMLGKVSNTDPTLSPATWMPAGCTTPTTNIQCSTPGYVFKLGDASILWRREIRHRNVVHASGGQVHSRTAPSPLAVLVPPGHQHQARQSPTGHTRWPNTPTERLSAGPHDFLSCRVASRPRPCHQPTRLIQREPREIPLDRAYAHLQVPKGNPRHRAHTR